MKHLKKFNEEIDDSMGIEHQGDTFSKEEEEFWTNGGNSTPTTSTKTFTITYTYNSENENEPTDSDILNILQDCDLTGYNMFGEFKINN